MRVQESCINGYIDQLITQLKNQETTDNGVVNIVQWFNFTTLDVIGDLAFGESLLILKNAVWSRTLSTIYDSVQFTANQRLMRRLFPLTWRAWIKLVTPTKMIEDRLFQYHLAKDKLAHRISNDTERADCGKIHPIDYLTFKPL